MKKLLIFTLFIISNFSFSQEDAWVYFTDKPNSQTYLNNPLTMLTQRALDRRTAQGISLDIKDVPINQSYIDQISIANGITVKAKSKWLNCVHVRGSVSDIDVLANLSFVDHIFYADNSLNSKMILPHSINPVNKQLDVQTDFNYGNAANQIEMLNGNILHQANYTGAGKIIAVLDSGFLNVDATTPFQRMFDNNLFLGGYNFVGGNNNVFSSHYHGTMTLSCMAGYVDGQLVGTAPDAQYYLYITEDVNSENPVEESYWVQAAEEADRLGVDIISTSLGYFGYDNSNYSHSYSDMTGNSAFASQGANIAFSKGIIVVASAGNSGSTSEPHVGVPAEATNVLAIGAISPSGSYVSFSSIGPSFDGRVKPDLMAQGQQSVVASTSGNITTANGTSFSCPIMAGVIACLWQALPDLTNQELINFIKQSADRFSNPNAQYGYGIPDFQEALNLGFLENKDFLSSNFSVFPNPTDDKLNLLIPSSCQDVDFILYNSLGESVLKMENINSLSSISLEQLNSGIYFYKLEGQSFSEKGRVVKK